MELDELKRFLKKKNLRITESRLNTYILLNKSSRPLNPKELFARAARSNKANLDLVSIYRNLELFEELGLAHRLPEGRYASCGQNEVCTDHPHLHLLATCKKCQKVFEPDTHSEEICHFIEELKSLKFGLKIIEKLHIEGLCKNCASS